MYGSIVGSNLRSVKTESTQPTRRTRIYIVFMVKLNRASASNHPSYHDTSRSIFLKGKIFYSPTTFISTVCVYFRTSIDPLP